MNKLLVEKNEFYTIIKLNRPNVRNAIDPDIIKSLIEITKETEQNTNQKGIIITSSEDKYFSSGGDLKYFLTLDNYEKGKKMSSEFNKIFEIWEKSSLLIIAAIEGMVIGGGVEFALGCDIRVVGEKASFLFKQGKLGLITGWGGTTRLKRSVSTGNALYILTSGEKIYATKAKELGFIEFITPKGNSIKKSIEILSSLKDTYRESIIAYKEILYDQSLNSDKKSFIKERELFAKLWDSPFHRKKEREFFKKN